MTAKASATVEKAIGRCGNTFMDIVKLLPFFSVCGGIVHQAVNVQTL